MTKAICFLLLALPCLVHSQSIQVGDLRCEYRRDPLGIDATVPRLSWKIVSDQLNVRQTSYEIRVFSNHDTLHPMWQTGRVRSGQSVNAEYGGPRLASRLQYAWQVRVWDNKDNVSPWSALNHWEMGLLSPSDWQARWISTVLPCDTACGPAIMFRKEFSLREAILSARLYVSGHGLYQATLNGRKIGDDELTPGWTSYRKRVQYQVYDVANMLSRGKNAIGAIVGDGWYRGYIAFDGNKNFYGDRAGLLCQLEITYVDGQRESICSDGTWKSSTGPIRMSEIYLGETYDARLELPGWDSPGYNDSSWSAVTVSRDLTDHLVATVSAPIRKHQTFRPIRISPAPDGSTIVDFGQNLVGWLQLRVNTRAGDTIRIRHGEVLDKDGNLYTENLRAARQTTLYITKGGGTESFEPHFTFYGFRYVSILGYPGTILSDDLTAVALYSDLEQTGTFTCSDSLLNKLFHNIQWGQRGNFLDVPTDCPQRDERLGWTGDAQAFSMTAALNMNVAQFFAKWLKDLALDQRADGAVPFVIPNVLDTNAVASAGWADAATVIPWNMYVAYGDRRILENQYSSMKAWVEYMVHKSRNYLWNTGFDFGDWLFYRPSDDNDGRSAVTDKYLIAQAYFAHSTQILIDAANVLGKRDDARHYEELLQHIKKAFLDEYVTPNGRLVSGTQTAYVLALDFDLLPVKLRKQAAETLVANIHSYDDHLTTGFLGTPHLCEVLTRFGHSDVAYTLLMQKTYPSWLYPVTKGATTIWERWDGIKPDGSFQNPGMNSFNHYAYGAIGEWLYRTVAGIAPDPDAPGFRKITIAPIPGGGLSSATAAVQSMEGPVRSSWKLQNGRLTVDITIPPNTEAAILLPHARSAKIDATAGESRTPVLIKPTITAEGEASFSIGSGTYQFQYVQNLNSQ